MSIVHLFELRCDYCDERFEDFFDTQMWTPAQARMNAIAKGWSRKKQDGTLLDLCPGCEKKFIRRK